MLHPARARSLSNPRSLNEEKSGKMAYLFKHLMFFYYAWIVGTGQGLSRLKTKT
jgi:hypothetical protein